MAIINNQTTANGDVLYIETTIPAIGLTALIGFMDDTEGEGGGINYKKTFQISKDGVTWSAWQPLTIANIQAVQVNKFDKIFLKYRYQQSGSGILEFNENVVEGIYENLDCPYYFNESIFKKYFSCNDLRVISWYINLTEKLYQGELNKYLKFDNGNGDETDAISFWQSVGKFFAFYVILSRIYRDFYLNEELINNYLLQRGLFTSKYNVLSEYNALMSNFNNEITKRGTRNILNIKNDENPYDGELRRYLNLSVDDDLVFDYYLPYHCGWWVDRSSPIYRGLEEHMNANKLKYEQYSLTSGATATINPNDPNDILIKSNSANQGLIYDGDETKLLTISKNVNYILEFDIRVLATGANLTLGANCYTINNEIIPNVLLNFKTNTNSNYFIQNMDLNKFASHSDKFFRIKCIIYNYKKPSPFGQDALNIGIGNNLKFVDNQYIRKIYPILTASGNVEIKNVYFRPLYTYYERGFISMNHFVAIDFREDKGENDVPSEWTGFNYTFDFNVE